MMDAFEEWAKNWKNAKAFFDSKGNNKTTARLKVKWYNGFMDTLKRWSQEKR